MRTDNEIKFGQHYTLYSRLEDHEVVLEIWGASTKHPDMVRRFSDFKKCEYFTDDVQIFQWILEIASKMQFPFHATMLAEWALKNTAIW